MNEEPSMHRVLRPIAAGIACIFVVFVNAAHSLAQARLSRCLSAQHPVHHDRRPRGQCDELLRQRGQSRRPNLDRIASEGMRFDRCFVTNSICTPSRATILTGKYSHMNGVPVFNRLDGSQPTVAKYLQAAGYHTGMIGKWHLGSEPTGFDEWSMLPGQGVYFDPRFHRTDNGRRVMKGYATDVITDLAIDFLKNRPKDKPFFLMCHHKAPHRPWDPDEKHKAMFAGKQIPEPATLRDDYSTRTDAIRECTQKVFQDLTRRDFKLEAAGRPAVRPSAAQWLQTKPTEVEIEVNGQKKTLKGEELNAWKYQRYLQDYLACIQSWMTTSGGCSTGWTQNGLRENTIVIYTSDQGFFIGEHGLFDKRFMYDPSLQMPFIIRWPGVVKPGSVQDAMIINADFAPTFMEVAGQPVPRICRGAASSRCSRARSPPTGAPACITATTTTPAITTPGRTTASAPHSQAHLLLEKRPVGDVRPDERPRRTA